MCRGEELSSDQHCYRCAWISTVTVGDVVFSRTKSKSPEVGGYKTQIECLCRRMVSGGISCRSPSGVDFIFFRAMLLRVQAVAAEDRAEKLEAELSASTNQAKKLETELLASKHVSRLRKGGPLSLFTQGR